MRWRVCSVNIKPLVCRVIVCDLSQISAKSASRNNKTSRSPKWQNLNYSSFVGKNFGQSFQFFVLLSNIDFPLETFFCSAKFWWILYCAMHRRPKTKKRSFTLLENYWKCLIWIPKTTNFCPLDLSGNTVCSKTIFGFFDELLYVQNINVARFARNVEWDFFCNFETLCCFKTLFGVYHCSKSHISTGGVACSVEHIAPLYTSWLL